MPNITLQYRIIINSGSSNQKEMELLKVAKPFLQDIPQRIWNINTSMNWNEIKAANIQQMQKIYRELTGMASFYLRNLGPRLPYILDRHQIQWPNFEVEVINFELRNPDSIELAVYFLSKQYRLVNSFGHFLLLAQVGENELNTVETFTIQLSSELSIHSYDI